MLKALYESKGLIDGATDSVVVDLHRANLASLINNEDTPKCGTVHLIVSVFDQHSVFPRDILTEIGEQRVLKFSESSFGPGSLDPCQVSVVRVCAHTKDTRVDSREVFD